MDQLKAMALFVAAADGGSFAAAARRTRTSRALVSKEIGRLEDHLGVRLFQRTTRRIDLTPEGVDYLGHCRSVLGEIKRQEERLSLRQEGPRGRLRVSAPLSYGDRVLTPLIGPFLDRYPDIRLDLELSDRIIDLVAEGFDAGIRIGRIDTGDMITRRLGETRHRLYAAPSYLNTRGTPEGLADLAAHDCLAYAWGGEALDWRLAAGRFSPRGQLSSSNGDFLLRLAIEGRGLVWLPDFFTRGLTADTLVELPFGAEPEPSRIAVQYPSRHFLPLPVRVFVDMLVDALDV